MVKNFNPFGKKKKKTTPNFKYQQEKFHKPIENNRNRIFELFYELIPEGTKHLKHSKNNQFIGYDNQNDTLAISMIDEKRNIVNIKRRQVADIKWLGLKGGSGKFSPHRLTGKEFVFVASGIAEFLILNASELDYIVMQSDGVDINALLPRAVTAVILEDNDKQEITNEADRRYQCFKNANQFNPFKKKVTKKIIGEKIAIDFEKVLDKELKAGYDLRDFVKEHTQNWLELIEKEIENQINQNIPVKEEIVTNYLGKFPTFFDIPRGVVISRQHTGKTHLYEGVAGTLIIVPRARQCNMFKGDTTESVLEKLFDDGAIITFHKFYGHYTSSEEFRELIDSKKIRLIIDEAQEIVGNPLKEFQLIYKLDAIFLSGTLEKFFRRDLQRYKYKPEKPDIIYFTTNGKLPNHYRPIVFMDNAKVLKANYPNNCVVGQQHDFKSVDIQTTTKDIVFTTSALREGISVKNPNFNACMVYAKECRLWNTKQTLQALYRSRIPNTIKIVSAPPKPQYTKNIDYEWWENFINNQTEDQITNTIMGEHYSEMMKITHKLNKYEKADEYSIVCYLSHLTRNNYDEDFFKFVEYKEDFEPLEINTKVENVNSSKEDEKFFNHMFENGKKWSIPQNKRKAFERWLEHDNSGFIAKLEKLDTSKNLNYIYLTSNVAKKVKAKYNKMYKHKGKRYSIKMFYNLLRSLVKLEIINDKTGNIIKRVGSKTELKDISIKVINRCAIIGVKVVKEVVKQAQKWLDSFEEVRKGERDRNIDVLGGFGVDIKGGNYYTILGV